jgi:hypothetical protein
MAKAAMTAFEKISWFPGHMYVASQKLKESLRDIDVFIEVRDARLPYSTLNIEVDDYVKTACKQKIVIFNKYDLCNHQVTLKAIHNLREVGLRGFAVSAINRINLKKIIDISREILPPKYENSVGSWMMIGGMPNVGKSTIINKLRQQAPEDQGKLHHEDLEDARGDAYRARFQSEHDAERLAGRHPGADAAVDPGRRAGPQAELDRLHQRQDRGQTGHRGVPAGRAQEVPVPDVRGVLPAARRAKQRGRDGQPDS